MRRFLFLVSVTCSLAVAVARAEEPAVTAVLATSETIVGQAVPLEIKLTGARGATLPESINVDGLDIRYTGQSQSFEMRNFSTTYSVLYSYLVLPLRPGSFIIPSQPVRVGSKVLKTPELTLHVADANGRSGRNSGGGNSGTIDPSQIAFCNLVLGKTTAYVGEMIPAEVRLGFNTRTPVESLGNGVDLSGQGFTTQKIRDPRQTIETIRGKTYQMFIFKTAISPVRPGKIDVGPIESKPVVRIPQQMNRNRSQMRDPFNMVDPFFDPFFNDPFFQPALPRELHLKSEMISLDVKPLPPNAPPSFNGAIGNFTMSADVKPKAGQVGDPLTIVAKITGRGNFDRVAAPALEDENGWHKYPPSSQFKQDDDVGLSGTKTFETVISANERKDKVPPVVFTYFDPAKEQYVTLRSEAVPVKIEGGAAPTPTVAQASAAPSPSAGETPIVAAKARDILYQMNELPARVEQFTPLYARREFWLAQLLPFAALIGYVLWQLRQRRLSDREAQRVAALGQEAAQLERKVARADLSAAEFYADAARAVQLRTAIARNMSPNVVDADVAANAFRFESDQREALRRLFDQSDELRYSGGNGNTMVAVAPETRREVLDLLARLQK